MRYLHREVIDDVTVLLIELARSLQRVRLARLLWRQRGRGNLVNRPTREFCLRLLNGGPYLRKVVCHPPHCLPLPIANAWHYAHSSRAAQLHGACLPPDCLTDKAQWRVPEADRPLRHHGRGDATELARWRQGIATGIRPVFVSGHAKGRAV